MKQSPTFLLPNAAWILVALGLILRLLAACSSPLWVDEAESSINGLTIVEHLLPVDHYLGQPIYENTLTEKWAESEEYEFRDSSYSKRGVAVYHAWLPLYAIAASQWLWGMEPDQASQPPIVPRSGDEVLARTLVPRLPALLFSAGFMAVMFLAGQELAGKAAGWSALTWSALEDGVINRSHQARYYSLTLLMTALFILLYFRVYRAGRTRDFVFLGLALGALFHTHQLSAVVASLAAVFGLPRIRQHEGWALKCGLSASLAAALILPWVVLSGFLDTATSVPKAFELFDGWQDWLRYAASQRVELAIAAGGLALIFTLLRTRVRPGLPETRERSLLFEQSVFICLWAGCALVAFHILIPAASFFPQRLTLMLIVPYGLLLAIVAGVLFKAAPPRFSKAAATIWTLAALLLTSHTLPVLSPSNKAEAAIAPMINALKAQRYPQDTRFYASPNFHLVWTYYTGLPVQSIAPVRKTFLDQHPSTIVYLELRWFNELAQPKQVAQAAASAGISITLEEASALARDLWRHQIGEHLATIPVAFERPPPLPDFMTPVAEKMRRLSEKKKTEHLLRYENHPMFKGLPFSDPNLLWLAFFYRFSDLEQRVGEHTNIRDRIVGSRAVMVPESRLVIYESEAALPNPQQAPEYTINH